MRPLQPRTLLKAERLRSSTKRLGAITLAWCVLLLALHVQGRAPRGTLFPSIGEFYYALEAAFLPAIVFLQWQLGRQILLRGGIDAEDVISNALFVSASCFVVPDCLLLLLARPDLLAVWARVAGPLALFAMLWVLHRSTRSWRITLWTTLVMVLPALLFVR
ncbi:MAG: hypothetical protein ACI9KE_000208 [Polyangiales bacterium]